MKIVYVINNVWFPGGQTRVLVNKVNYWAEHGHEVYILTADQYDLQPFYPIDPRVKLIDSKAWYMGLDNVSKWRKVKGNIQRIYKHYHWMKAKLSEIRPDILVSMYSKEIYFLPFIKDGSVKLVEAHGGRYTWDFSRPGLFGRLHNWIDSFFLQRFDRFVVLTEEDLPNWGFRNIINVPNGNTFDPAEVSSLESKTVIAVGRVGEQKNFENMLQAWAIVHSKHPDWKLKICGQGLDLLNPLIEELRLQDAVVHYETKNMEPEYMDASICALSSRHEGMPMFLLEAQACGLPVVSYACPCGPRDIIRDGVNGILIEELEDYHKLAEGICRLIEDEPLRKSMGRKAKERSLDFALDRVMERWEHLFEELLKERDAKNKQN